MTTDGTDMKKARYKSQDEAARRNQKIFNCGKIDARGVATRQAGPRAYGVLAGRVYGPAVRCKVGIIHFST